MPRTIGRRKNQCRAITERIGRLTSAISPSGLRTASAQVDGPRIITPSRTAWPPMGALDTSRSCPCGRRRPSPAGAGTARRGLPCRRASASPCRTGGTRSRSRRGARTSSNASGTRCRRSSERSLGRTQDGSRPSFEARIAEAISGATLPPETTTATVSCGSTSIFPARRAATPDRCGGLAGELGPAVEEAHSVCDLVLRDEHGLDAASRQIRIGCSPAKGALRPSAIDLGSTRTDRPPRGPCAERPRGSGSTATMRRPSAPSCDARDETTTADRHDDDRCLRDVLDDLEPDRALARDRQRVVEGMHEGAAQSPPSVSWSRSNAWAGPVRLEVDSCAVRARGLDLLRARAFPT